MSELNNKLSELEKLEEELRNLEEQRSQVEPQIKQQEVVTSSIQDKVRSGGFWVNVRNFP